MRACISIHIIYMGWQRCLLYGDCPKPGADSNVAVAAKPFSVDFDVAAPLARFFLHPVPLLALPVLLAGRRRLWKLMLAR